MVATKLPLTWTMLSSSRVTELTRSLALIGWVCALPDLFLLTISVRNSWSAKWGEKGYIRLRRFNEEGRCGIDVTPGNGDGCKDGPDQIKVCGTCGILYDNAYPVVSVPKVRRD